MITQLEYTATGMVMRKRLLESVFMVLVGTSVAPAQGSLPESSLPAMPSSAVAPLNPQLILSSGVLENGKAGGASAGTSPQFWASAEYLLWWIKGGSVPPLVTTGPALPLTPPPGSFAAPGTGVLFGGDERD